MIGSLSIIFYLSDMVDDMTKLLEKAFGKALKLPELEQNIIAHWLIEELVSEKNWEQAFAKSEDILAKLASEALDEHQKGKTRLLNMERL